MTLSPSASVILSGLTHPVLVLDEISKIIFSNPSGEEFFQTGLGHLLQSSLADYISPPHEIFEMLQRSRLSRSSLSSQDIELSSPYLGERLVDVQISPLADYPDLVILALQERALARRLRGAENFQGAARSVASISALLSHEIKNPLAGIRGAAELLGGDGAADKDALLDLIVTEADRIAALLTRVEDMATGHDIDAKPVNIHEVINHCLALAKSSFGRNHTIETVFDPSLPAALGDKDLLIQLFLNLIKNACEASPTNFPIMIKTLYNLDTHYAKGQIDAPLVVEIIDRGKGIAPHLADDIFAPFVTDKSGGRGLGLALVASVVSAHKGTVDVSSQLNGGTAFRVSLRLASDGASEGE